MIESGKWVEPEPFATRWCATVGGARRWLAEQGGEHPRYRELRYERLVMNPKEEMAGVLRFLDEPWEAQGAGVRRATR